MITTEITYDHTVSTEGRISVRTITTYIEDGEILATKCHRKIVNPRIADLTNEDEVTQTLATALLELWASQA